ncbi:hypothetical protein K450DRAFT_243058 [Umbelopsis ramanniana AG]|uniref:Bromo domain-containing protein n=1 Tax=Umbelopsis ramanniana AG TaxID=1314678 RepID=A0AAD5EA45_UMBRA|nr:uncharacterized protein K450DRAFT_243058 [Umbelopsis ramanniana AG]KAI8579161.1 hypothetical protein K450DRAFT_243058 [Umbelopsis ramanniana AG]
MADSEAEGSNNHSSQQEDSLVLQDRELQPDELSTVEGSVLDSVGAGTRSPASPHYTAGRRERTLRQRKHVNYTEPADNPLKDHNDIKRQFRQGENHKTTASLPAKRGRGRPPKYAQAQQQQHSNALQSIRSSSRNQPSVTNSRFQPVRYSKRSLQARDDDDDDDEDHENDAYESLRTKVRRLSQSNDAKLNSSSRYNMRTRSKEVDHAEDNRDDEGDDEGEDEDDDDDVRPTKHSTRTQSRMQDSFLDTGSPSVDEERAPNAQYSLRTRKNVSYSENHVRAGFEARASPSPKSYSPSLRSTRVSRWRISNEANGGLRNLPSEKAYHLRKRAHPPNFYAVPPPPVIPPKPTSNVRPHRSHRASSLFRHIGSGSSDEESIRRNVKQLRGGESGSRILPLNLLELKGSRDSSLLGPAVLTDQNSISDKLEGQSFNFESIGGLDHHIKSLKEMILLPLLYPELYANFQITPPRGALLYGPPGTGKTLMARALANSCSTQTQKVAFFMRKGADCLSKWVGEAERELKLLFEEAKKWQPSIIFFDEIDGLAPVRSAKAEQTHTSVVSTLLALMDGLDSRGQVIVLGATNRIDAIDPALRRPGRFDREFYFPLPNEEARSTIIEIATREWEPPVPVAFKKRLAQVSKGYSGADLKALCTEAALNSIRRTYPQIYESSDRLLVSPQEVHVKPHDFLDSAKSLVPSSFRSADAVASPLPDSYAILLRDQFKKMKEFVFKTIPPKINNSLLDEDTIDDESKGLSVQHEHFTLTGSSEMRTYKPRLLINGMKGFGQKHVAAALLDALEGHHVQSFDLAILMGDSVRSPEAICVQLFTEVKRHRPSVIYVPNIHIWWHAVSDMVRNTFINLLNDIHPYDPILLLATSDVLYEDLPSEVQQLFRHCMLGRWLLGNASKDEVAEFFNFILLQAMKTPEEYKRRRKAESETAQQVLRRAPPLPPRQLSESEKQKLKSHDVHVLREFRRELRCVVEDLLKNKRFKYFAYPVDNEEYPEYYTLIRHPMDLNKIMNKINEGKYFSVADFLRDIHIIRYNTEFYHGVNEDVTIRAYALVDDVESFVHSLNPELIAELSATAKRRKLVKDEERKAVNHKYFTRTASERGVKTRGMEKKTAENENVVEESIDHEYLDYISKLRESYDSGFQNSLNATDTLPASDTEENTDTQYAPVLNSHIQAASIEDSAPQVANTKESTPASQPEITSSLVKPAIVIDAENNPFTAIIENGVDTATTDNAQGDAAGPVLVLEENSEKVITQEETPSETKPTTIVETNHIATEAKSLTVDPIMEDHSENDLENLVQSSEPQEFQIDHVAIKALLDSVAVQTQSWPLDEICHLRAEMLSLVHENRMLWSKEPLLQELKELVETFTKDREES